MSAPAGGLGGLRRPDSGGTVHRHEAETGPGPGAGGAGGTAADG